MRQVIEGDMMARQEKCMLRCSVLMVRQKMEDRSKVPESVEFVPGFPSTQEFPMVSSRSNLMLDRNNYL